MSQSSPLGQPTQICLRNTVGLTSPGVSPLNIGLCLLGDVVCLQVFGQVVVVLCSPTAIKDLLEKRGELYADRTPFPIFEMFA